MDLLSRLLGVLNRPPYGIEAIEPKLGPLT